MSREYFAVSSLSQYFDPRPVEERKCDRHLYCQLLVLKRREFHVICFAVNGKFIGQFKCGIFRKSKYSVSEVGEYYVFRSNAPYATFELGFTPAFTPSSSVAGHAGLGAQLLYDNCSIVSEEEASEIVTRGTGTNKAIRLSGVCAWAVSRDGEVSIYAFSLKYDLYMACCDRSQFPSMAKMYADTVRCDQECLFCRDHEKHVDPTARFIGCIPDMGVCFCCTPCTTPVAKITHTEHLPFFTEADDADSLGYDIGGVQTLSPFLAKFVTVLDSSGTELKLKNGPWQLIKIEPALSRLIILACPVLKRLVYTMTE